MNLISQTRSFYEPDFEVDSMAEQSAIVAFETPDRDYIQEWAQAWTVDHYFEASGDFNQAATAVYFD